MKMDKLKAEINKGVDQLDRGESVDGRAFFEELSPRRM